MKVNLPDREEHWVRFRRLSWMRQLLLRTSSRVFSSRRCQCIVYTMCMSPGAYSTSSSANQANRIAFKTLNRPVAVVSGWVQPQCHCLRINRPGARYPCNLEENCARSTGWSETAQTGSTSCWYNEVNGFSVSLATMDRDVRSSTVFFKRT